MSLDHIEVKGNPRYPKYKKKPGNSKRGRKELEIDEQQVYELAKIMCTMEEISAVMRCSAHFLEQKFLGLIHKGWQEGKASLRRLQWTHAQKSFVMSIWLGKQYLEQAEPMPRISQQDVSELRKFLELHDQIQKSHEEDSKSIDISPYKEISQYK